LVFAVLHVILKVRAAAILRLPYDRRGPRDNADETQPAGLLQEDPAGSSDLNSKR
jgi:hypothetical protein